MIRKEKKIVLLAGGTSPEREVSKESGKSIYNALISLGYDTQVVDPAYGKNQPDRPEEFFGKDISEINDDNYIETFQLEVFNNADAAVIALHGKHGEDGVIQSLLELRGIPYTGSGVLASSLSMDKNMTKIIFRHFGVVTPDWFVLNGKENPDEIVTRIKNSFGYPCIIKPNDQGSTIGLSICDSPEETAEAVKLAFRFSGSVMVEDYIEGREMSVTVLGEESLPVLEIKPKHKLYDYECKYTDGMSEYFVPADIDKETEFILREQAILAYNALGIKTYGRVDFRLDPSDKAFCLEVNTLPGMTSHSLVPKMAKAAGISFEQLVDRIVKSALDE